MTGPSFDGADEEKPLGLVRIGDVAIDTLRFRVTRLRRTIEMSTLEFRILLFLATHPDKVFSREEIARHCGSRRTIDSRSIDAYVARIRKKMRLRRGPDVIQTVIGQGYVYNKSGSSQRMVRAMDELSGYAVSAWVGLEIALSGAMLLIADEALLPIA